jgi:CRP-like cAMP-binding protein
VKGTAVTATTTPIRTGDRSRTATEADLASLDSFASLNEASLSQLSAALVIVEYQTADVLMRQGEPGTSFLIVLDGAVTVSRSDGSDSRTLGTARRGSILGELTLLTRGPRHATVTAASSVRAAVGGEGAFELLLGAPGMYERLTCLAAPRFAAVADRVPVTVPDGGRFLVRPLIATDRQELTAAFARQSQEFIQRRFFTSGRPSKQLIDYLINIDYVDHFAWRVSSDDGGDTVAEGRYIRRRDDHEVADIAFDVFDDYQGRGLATLLLGALAVAASKAGIIRFVAEVMYENRPMRAVLSKAHATWKHYEPGVVTGHVDVTVAATLIQDPPRSELARTARPVVTAAGLAVHGRQVRSQKPAPSCIDAAVSASTQRRSAVVARS